MIPDQFIMAAAQYVIRNHAPRCQLGPDDFIAIYRFLCEMRRLEAEERGESVPPPGGCQVLFPGQPRLSRPFPPGTAPFR